MSPSPKFRTIFTFVDCFGKFHKFVSLEYPAAFLKSSRLLDFMIEEKILNNDILSYELLPREYGLFEITDAGVFKVVNLGTIYFNRIQAYEVSYNQG